MPGNFIKEDLRIIKTQKSILNAFVSLLERHNFKHITVNDLCEEAFISRSAFYTHFKDKFDLLESWLSTALSGFSANINNILDIVYNNNHKLTKNIIEDADAETLDIIHNIAIFYLDSLLQNSGIKKDGPEYVVFSNFCTGGVIYHIMRQVKNKYQPDMEKTKQYFHDLIKCLIEWNEKRDVINGV